MSYLEHIIPQTQVTYGDVTVRVFHGFLSVQIREQLPVMMLRGDVPDAIRALRDVMVETERVDVSEQS